MLMEMILENVEESLTLSGPASAQLSCIDREFNLRDLSAIHIFLPL